MKTRSILILICLFSAPTFAQFSNWPANSLYIYFGVSELDQTNAANYSLLQAKSNGTTFLNSPTTILFRIGNVDKMTLANSGYMGIGTTTPWSKLHVNSPIERETFRLYKDGNTTNYLSMWQGTGGAAIDPIGTGKLYLGYDMTTDVYVNGKVGIGNTSPGYKLDVTAPAGDFKARFQGPDGYITIGPANAAWAHIYSDRPAFIFNQSIYSYNGNFSSYNTADLTLQTNGVTRLNISNANGNVGIGTTTPGHALSIVTGQQDVLSVKSSSHSVIDIESGSGLNSYVRFKNSGANKWDLASETGGNIRIYDYVAGSSRLVITPMGNVGIGTTNPNQKLTVNGTIYGKEVKVDLSVPGPDYVFEKDYDLPSLEEIKKYIDENKHLPEVPSAKEMESNGINLGEMNMILLKKVEELTLYLIELKRENERQSRLNEQQQNEIEKLKNK